MSPTYNTLTLWSNLLISILSESHHHNNVGWQLIPNPTVPSCTTLLSYSIMQVIVCTQTLCRRRGINSGGPATIEVGLGEE